MNISDHLVISSWVHFPLVHSIMTCQLQLCLLNIIPLPSLSLGLTIFFITFSRAYDDDTGKVDLAELRISTEVDSKRYHYLYIK